MSNTPIRISNLHIKDSKSVNEYAYAQNKNFPTRQYMQDNFIAQDNFPVQNTGLFAILDGHGGSKVSQYCVDAIPRLFSEYYSNFNMKMNLENQINQNNQSSHNIKQIFINLCSQIDQQLKLQQAQDIGTTCCLAFIRQQKNMQKNKITKICTVGNLGDTRAVICENGQAKRVTVDHKVSNYQQEQRIKSQGGCIFQGRVGGQLAITRALGDLAFKSIGASNVPQIQEFQITPQIQFMIIASDGLWDVCQDSKAIQMVREIGNTKLMAKKLIDYATKNGSQDNISVLVIRF